MQYCVIRREVYSTLCVWPWATQVRMVSKLDSTGGSCLQLSWHYDILNGGWLATLQQSNTAMDVGSFQWEIMEHIMDMFLGFSWIFHFQLRLNTSWWNITTNTSIPSWNCRASLGSKNRVPHCIRYLGIVVPDFQTDPHNNYIYIYIYNYIFWIACEITTTSPLYHHFPTYVNQRHGPNSANTCIFMCVFRAGKRPLKGLYWDLGPRGESDSSAAHSGCGQCTFGVWKNVGASSNGALYTHTMD